MKWSDPPWKAYSLLHEQEINFYFVEASIALGFSVTCSQGLPRVAHASVGFLLHKSIWMGKRDGGWNQTVLPSTNHESDMGLSPPG